MERLAVLQFSGGKDSTAALYMMRPWLERITVLFGDTGAVYPHVVRFVHETCEKLGARLEVVRPEIDVLAFTARDGFPSDLVPVEVTGEMAPHLTGPPAQRVQSYLRCCSAMLWEPMHRAVKRIAPEIVLRGVKKCDARQGVPQGHVEEGITYLSPIWEWSDADVMDCLKREGVELPEHYATVPDSLDCWCCSAHLLRHGAGKLAYTRKHYPDLWPELARRVRAVRSAADAERERLAPAFDLAG